MSRRKGEAADKKGSRGARNRAARPAQRREERGAGRERKERVLHTRISDQLARDIYRVAEDLRVPVSNLVRNVLEDVFSVMESVTDNVGHLIEDVMDEAERVRERIERHRQRAARSRPPAAGGGGEDVLGWQPLVLERQLACARCGAVLARGAQALLGIGTHGPTGTVICPDCVDRG